MILFIFRNQISLLISAIGVCVKFGKIGLISLISVLFFSCSSTKESTSENSTDQEVYVFDDVENVDENSHEAVEVTVTQKVNEETKTEPEPIDQVKPEIEYIVQVGAFSTKEKADIFISQVKNKTSYTLISKFRETVKLFVVQLPPFNTRAEAEKVRNELWKTDEFSDAFIVTN